MNPSSMAMLGVPLLSHRPELDEMAIRHVVTKGEEDVQRAEHIVVLGEQGVFAIKHRERSGRLLCKVHDGVRHVALEHGRQEVPIEDVADLKLDDLPTCRCPRADAFLERSDRRARLWTPISASQRRLIRLSTATTWCPRSDRCKAVGRPQ